MFKKLKQALKSLLNDNNVVTIAPIEVLVPAPVIPPIIPIEKASQNPVVESRTDNMKRAYNQRSLSSKSVRNAHVGRHRLQNIPAQRQAKKPKKGR